MVIAADRLQARVVFRYIIGLFDSVPMLAQPDRAPHPRGHPSAQPGDDRSPHGLAIERVRGYTVVAAILRRSRLLARPTTGQSRHRDRQRPPTRPWRRSRPPCSWPSAPVRPQGRALGGLPGSLRPATTTPCSSGRRTRPPMNPTIDPAVIAAAYQADERPPAPSTAPSSDGTSRPSSRGGRRRRVVPGRRRAGPRCRHRLHGLCRSKRRLSRLDDPGGGPSGRRRPSGGRCRARAPAARSAPSRSSRSSPPCWPAYRIDRVTGDRYAGEWPREPFRTAGIAYELADRSKSDLYRDLLPLLNSGRVELVDNPRLLAQLLGLERRTARGGKDSIDHGPQGKDDVVNSVAGALVSLARALPALIFSGPNGFVRVGPDGRDLPGPSVAELQAESDRELAERAAASAEQIRKAIAERGCWFPGDS